MEKNATVKEVFDNNTVKLSVNRVAACAGDCESCHGCGHEEETLFVVAQNTVNAQVGDTVVVESESGTLIKLAALLYIMPLILMFAFYAIPGPNEGVKILYSMSGLLFGLLICYFYSKGMKKRQEVTFKVTKILRR